MQCLCFMHWNLRHSVMRGLSFSDVLYYMGYMGFAQCIMLHSVRSFCFSANTCGSFSSFWSCGDVFSVTASKRMQRLHFKLLADFTNATNLVNKVQQDARAHHSPSFRACQVTGTFCNLGFCSVCFGVCESHWSLPIPCRQTNEHTTTRLSANAGTTLKTAFTVYGTLCLHYKGKRWVSQ